MAVPVRTKAPAGPVVEIDDLKSHLHVDGDEEDATIRSMEKSAVSMLDGYRGLLGRCVLEQEWAVTFGEAGTFRLPLPDVFEVSAVGDNGGAVMAVLTHDALGSSVTINAPATVTMKVKLPEDALDAVRIAVKLLVGHWFENRETAVTGTIATNLPLAFDAVVDTIRRVRA